MLSFNLARILVMRGIETPYAFLLKIGVTRSVAYRLTNYRVENIKIAHLEKICRALNCTPNDLFEWTPGETDSLAERHSLNSLKKTNRAAPRLNQIVKEIPIDKLGRVEELLTRLKNEE